MTVCFLSFDKILSRVLKWEHSLNIYKVLLDKYGEKESEKKPLIKEYETANRKGKGELLRDSARKVRKRGLTQYEGYDWEDILSELIFERTNRKWRNIVFGHTDNEEDLYPLLRRYLKSEKGFEIHPTYDFKKERWPDLYGVRWGRLWGKRTIAVDAKVSYNQFGRFLDQATNFVKYSHEVYLGATPGLVAEIGAVLDGIATSEEMLVEKLRRVSAGAIVVDMTDREIVKKIDTGESGLLDKQHLDRRLRILYPRVRTSMS